MKKTPLASWLKKLISVRFERVQYKTEDTSLCAQRCCLNQMYKEVFVMFVPVKELSIFHGFFEQTFQMII
jgi:hypothetical protein